jgi:hypothetical protein
LSVISWIIARPACLPAQAITAESVSVKTFGAKGDGVSDDRPAIQAAIDSIRAGVVYLPPAPGGYLVKLASKQTSFIVLKSHVQLIGMGHPIIRVAPSSPPYDRVISSSHCDGCSIEDLTIDANIEANPIKDQHEIYAHPRIEIVFDSGSGIRIHNVTIRNSSAVNSIVTGVPVSELLITHCVFAGIGDDPNHIMHDHSTLYIHAEGAVIDGNLFTSVRRGAPAAVTAIETHGSGMAVTGNVITDYAAGMNLTGVAPSDSIGNVVHGNTIRGALVGMEIWSNTYQRHSSGYGIYGLVITGNSITVNQNSYVGAEGNAPAAGGIIVDPNSNLPVANVVIADNTVVFDLEKSPRHTNNASIGIGWYSTIGQGAEAVIIAGNIINNAPVAGIRLAAALTGCRVTGNIIRNAASSLDTAIAADYKAPIFIAGAPSIEVEIADNQIIDTLEPSRMRTALLLSTSKGISSGLRVRGNSVTLMASNKTSFSSYVRILDDLTKPLLTATWDDFTVPARKVASGSEINDPKNGKVWRAGSDGALSTRP